MNFLLADDHPLYREGVKAVLRVLDPHCTIVECKDYDSTFALIRQYGNFDLALVDLYMPGMVGYHGIEYFRRAFPGTPLVVISAADLQDDTARMLEIGVMGFINKTTNAARMLEALGSMLAGETHFPFSSQRHPQKTARAVRNLEELGLTQRQNEVLLLLSIGCNNKEISSRLDISEGTVKIHLSALYRALNVSNRTEAVLTAQNLRQADARRKA